MQFLHSIAVIDKGAARNDALVVGALTGIANVAGASAGASVVTAVTVPANELPPNYTVMVNPGQDATWFVSGKTPTGFNVTLTSRLAANTLAAGTFDVLIVA